MGLHPITLYLPGLAQTLWGSCALVLGVLLGPILVWKALLYIVWWQFGRMAAGWAKESMVRAQHVAFVLKLRDRVFGDPFGIMNMLCSKEADGFVRKFWQEVGDVCVRDTAVGGASSGMRAVRDEVGGFHPVRLSDEGLGVQRIGLADGRVLAVVKLPPPLVMGETHLIGVVLPPDESLKQDLERARKLARFFVVDRWEGERDTDFCQWTINGKKLTYNVGAPLDPNGFAAAIGQKLEEEEGRPKRTSLGAIH